MYLFAIVKIPRLAKALLALGAKNKEDLTTMEDDWAKKLLRRIRSDLKAKKSYASEGERSHQLARAAAENSLKEVLAQERTMALLDLECLLTTRPEELQLSEVVIDGALHKVVVLPEGIRNPYAGEDLGGGYYLVSTDCPIGQAIKKGAIGAVSLPNGKIVSVTPLTA